MCCITQFDTQTKKSFVIGQLITTVLVWYSQKWSMLLCFCQQVLRQCHLNWAEPDLRLQDPVSPPLYLTKADPLFHMYNENTLEKCIVETPKNTTGPGRALQVEDIVVKQGNHEKDMNMLVPHFLCLPSIA